MRCARTALLLASTFVAACAGGADKRTLAGLRDVEPDVTEIRVENSLEQAIVGYRAFLEEAPESALTPEAMRRLADLEIEKEYGILGGDGKPVELPAPPANPTAATSEGLPASDRPRPGGIADHSEAEAAFERRAAGEHAIADPGPGGPPPLPGREQASSDAGPLEAIALYDRILATYPSYEHNDRVLYQKARAFDELGRNDEAIAVIEQLIAKHPYSRHVDEVQFRRAEYFFVRKKYLDAEEAYAAITARGAGSEYYELALYKLGWTFYKQELHEEALDEYVELLDHKVSTGYDFDQSQDEADERRVADTFRVISLCFSNLGGAEVVERYFAASGNRSYEDRVYSHLAEFYLEKLRYHDAAAAYEAFVGLYPLHRVSPHFGMRVVEIYEAGGFPKLVLESKKDFADRYGLQSEYWRHFDVAEAPEVLHYLKANLEDLASHYHALYQEAELAEEKPENFQEALRWYRAYLTSFPEDSEAPAVHHRLADLLLENEDFATAAREYERTAYDYPAHEQAAAAGYAAIYAHRENQKRADGSALEAARREAVTSTLRFVAAFPEHEHAASVLGAAVDDLYDMKEFERAIATGHQLIDAYPNADRSIRRSAWAVVAHASFDTADFPQAEDAYARVLEMTPEEDEARAGVIDNLAAAIYKQGEQANAAEDPRAAAGHFLRVAQVAPTSTIRPVAEYDASAALIRLEDWSGAASVLESFRETHPEHELAEEATRQIAFVYRQLGDVSRAAGEYERIAAESDDPALRRDALLVAGELYEEAGATEPALAVYLRYVEQFPEPLEMAVETRFKVAGMYEAIADEASRHAQLRRIVELDATAGSKRTPRVRVLAARSALVLTEGLYERFGEIALVQPFETHLQEKQRRMSVALDAFGRLVDYEVGDVTAAATFYMAEVYYDFSEALIGSERPTGLGPAEMQDYEMVLEEEAFPFEEKAIEVHEKNLELLASGVYNPWIEKSLARLAELMPGRYAKAEASSGFIRAIDRYAYQAPRVRALALEPPAPAPAEPQQAVPPAETGETELAAPAEAAGDEAELAAPAQTGEAIPAPPEPDVPADASDAAEAAAPADAHDAAEAAAPADAHDAAEAAVPASQAAPEPTQPQPEPGPESKPPQRALDGGSPGGGA